MTSRADIAKIEQVHARGKLAMSVDLLLDKTTGLFFAQVNGKRVEANTKEKAVKLVVRALDEIANVVWREVIVLRVGKEREGDEDDTIVTHENSRRVFGSLCSFTYFRRERAANPTNPKKQIEREHPVDFEARVALVRKRYLKYGGGVSVSSRDAADARERELRHERATLMRVEQPWDPHNDQEHELPYTPEAWAGIQRIAQTLRDTQAKLNAFARGATSESLAQLAAGGGDLFKRLGPVQVPEQTVYQKQITATFRRQMDAKNHALMKPRKARS